MWTGLTYSNASKYCPREVRTTKGHMVKSSQDVRSTKKNTTPPLSIKEETLKDAPEEEYLEDIPPPTKTNKLHIWENQSVNCILMIAAAFQFDQDAETIT